MKKGIVLLTALLVLSVGTFAKKPPRNSNSAVGNNNWSVSFGMDLADFYSPKLKKLQTFKTPVVYGPRVGFWRNFNSSIALGLDVASYAFTSKLDDPTLPLINTYNLLYAGSAVYKFNNGYILKEDAAVAPFIFAKIQGTWAKQAITQRNVNGFGIPIGAGINFKIAHNVAMSLNGGYTFGVKNSDDHIFFGAGVMLDLGKGDKVEDTVPVQTQIILADKDGDGIPDLDDACPDVPGLPQFAGCPDTDGDGIEDSKDECPTVAGLAEFNGCPDTDGDGIPDVRDACPNEKGIAKFGGCPDPDRDGDGVVNDKDKCPDTPGPIPSFGCPDRDGDGVMDSNDRCPDQAGPASNQGCPEMKAEEKKVLMDARNIQFETGKAVIRPASYKILDKVAEILKTYSYYDVSIEGHTDNVGKADYNQKLSEDRAASAMQYLINKGVPANKMSSKGFGLTKPIAENTTAVGRAENRRVEFNLIMK